MSVLVANQRFAALAPFQASSLAGPEDPVIIRLASGGFVAAWENNHNFYAQIFDRHGAPVGGNFTLQSLASFGHFDVSLAPLPSGGFVASWQSIHMAGTRVEIRLFDASGAPLGPETVLNAASNAQPNIAPLTGGGLVVTYTGNDGDGEEASGIKAHRLADDGTKAGDEIFVNTNTSGQQYYPLAAGLPGGGFVVIWTDFVTVRGQIFDASGERVGGQLDLAPNTGWAPSLATLADGNFILTYTLFDDLKAKIFSPTGALVVAEFGVATSTAGVQYMSSVVPLETGEFLVTWRDAAGSGNYIEEGEIKGQLFSAGGVKVGAEFQVNVVTSEGQSEPVSTGFGSGDFATLWIDYSSGFPPKAEIGLLFSTELGTAGDDQIAGTSDRDFVFALDGGDSVAGGAGDDELDGGSGDDFLQGGNGNDVIHGGDGDDQLEGGAGNDFLLLQDGGDDIALGGEGNDVIYFGTALSAGDVADGGTGRDAVVLQGNVTALFTDTNLVGIESISIQSGANTRFGDTANNFYDFDVTTADGNVPAGQQLIVNAQSLRVGEDFTFDGSAESDGRFLVYGGHGVDDLTGGDGVDVFFFEGSRWGPDDKVDGGEGRDAVVISAGSGVTHIEFAADALTSIESISLNNRYATDPSQKPSYELVLHNGNVAAGGTLIVNGFSLTDPSQTVMIDGSGVEAGNLILFGGAGQDVLIGGAGGDILYGAGGSDELTGGSGADRYQYHALSDSAPGDADIIHFVGGTALIDVSRIDSSTLREGNQTFQWIGSNPFSPTSDPILYSGQLRAVQSNGTWFVEGDVNADGIADFALEVIMAPSPFPLGSNHFIL